MSDVTYCVACANPIEERAHVVDGEAYHDACWEREIDGAAERRDERNSRDDGPLSVSEQQEQARRLK